MIKNLLMGKQINNKERKKQQQLNEQKKKKNENKSYELWKN